MSYKKLLNKIAKENGTTAKDVDNEMRMALKMAGLDIEPAAFISLVSTKVKNDCFHK